MQSVLIPDEIGHFRVVTVLLHAALEQANHVLEIGVLRELQLSAVTHEFLELVRLALAELVQRNLNLLFLDIAIFLVFTPSGKTLPRQTPLKEVEQYVSDGLEVVSTGLFISNMRVDACIAGSSCQVLALSEGDVLSFGVLVAFGEPKINNKYAILIMLLSTDQKVIRFNVSVNYALFMGFLDTLHLLTNS